MTELRRRFPPGVGDISDELIRLVADETGVPFVVIDLDGVVHYASGSVTKLGWEPAAVVGSNIVDYIDGDSHELAAAGMAEFADGLETHEGLPVDFEMCRQDGSRLWVEVGGTPLHARDGRMFVVLRLRHADGKHHLDEFFVALTEADSFEAVLSPLVRSIAAESEGVAAAVHHGFDGRAFAGVVSFGLPPGLLLDPAPWVDAVGSTETLVRTGFATGDGVGPSSTAWLVPVPGAGAITPAVLSLWRAYRGPPLLGHRLQLARNVRHVQLALRRVSEHEQLRYLARHDALTGVANRPSWPDSRRCSRTGSPTWRLPSATSTASRR